MAMSVVSRGGPECAGECACSRVCVLHMFVGRKVEETWSAHTRQFWLVCVCVCACVRACVRTRACPCVRLLPGHAHERTKEQAGPLIAHVACSLGHVCVCTCRRMHARSRASTHAEAAKAHPAPHTHFASCKLLCTPSKHPAPCALPAHGVPPTSQPANTHARACTHTHTHTHTHTCKLRSCCAPSAWFLRVVRLATRGTLGAGERDMATGGPEPSVSLPSPAGPPPDCPAAPSAPPLPAQAPGPPSLQWLPPGLPAQLRGPRLEAGPWPPAAQSPLPLLWLQCKEVRGLLVGLGDGHR